MVKALKTSFSIKELPRKYKSFVEASPPAFPPFGQGELFYFDDSQRRVANLGARHLRPSEAFYILAEAKTAPKSSSLHVLRDSMFSQGTMWLDASFSCLGNWLIVALGPRNIRWAGHGYVAKDRESSNEWRINLNGLTSGFTPLAEVNKRSPDLVTLLLGRGFDELPQELHRTSFYLEPNLDSPKPVSLVSSPGYFLIDGGGRYLAGSRGIN